MLNRTIRKRQLPMFIVACLLAIAACTTLVRAQAKPSYICTERYLPDFKAAGGTETFWTKKTLTVKFLNGTPFVQQKVMQLVPEWSRFANIEFKFVNSGDADIRIAFKYQATPDAEPDEGSWSYVGNQARGIPRTEPTMNYGWFDETTDDEEFRRVILHEFGHALGMIHEHQAPESPIKWKRDVVIDYYQRTQGWSVQDIEQQVFGTYSKEGSQYTQYDPLSIMHYPLPAWQTEDGETVGWNTVLSDNDKLFVASIYPRARVANYVIVKGKELPAPPSGSLAGQRVRSKFTAPFAGYLYVIDMQGKPHVMPAPSSNRKRRYSKGQLVVVNYPAGDAVYVFSPTEITRTRSAAVSKNSSDVSTVQLPAPAAAFPRVKGAGPVSAVTCSYMQKWLGSQLAIPCGDTNPAPQPIFARISLSQEK